MPQDLLTECRKKADDWMQNGGTRELRGGGHRAAVAGGAEPRVVLVDCPLKTTMIGRLIDRSEFEELPIGRGLPFMRKYV